MCPHIIATLQLYSNQIILLIPFDTNYDALRYNSAPNRRWLRCRFPMQQVTNLLLLLLGDCPFNAPRPNPRAHAYLHAWWSWG